MNLIKGHPPLAVAPLYIAVTDYRPGLGRRMLGELSWNELKETDQALQYDIN
ncbi:MAG: hypothetical protein RDU59_04290 [Thermodesulfobacteriota bacterium]|nr:hypothetical protein [Thermodesulfobacteriota bacterium]